MVRCTWDRADIRSPSRPPTQQRSAQATGLFSSYACTQIDEEPRKVSLVERASDSRSDGILFCCAPNARAEPRRSCSRQRRRLQRDVVRRGRLLLSLGFSQRGLAGYLQARNVVLDRTVDVLKIDTQIVVNQDVA